MILPGPRALLLASSLDRNEIAIVSPKSTTSGQMSEATDLLCVDIDWNAAYMLLGQTINAPSCSEQSKDAKGSRIIGESRPLPR